MSNGLSTALPANLPATGYATVLPREIINGSAADVVDANVDVVNAMYADFLDVEEIAPNALRSHYVDFYLTQALGGGFAQYVFTAPEREETDAHIRAGLETEDITALNAAWLRGQANLLVLDDGDIDRHIAERVSRIPNLAERQAEAAEDDLADTLEFEVIIRELCHVAGHTLLKITLGDPNYDHDGQTTLAWHFTTDQGEFLMLDDEL